MAAGHANARDQAAPHKGEGCTRRRALTCRGTAEGWMPPAIDGAGDAVVAHADRARLRGFPGPARRATWRRPRPRGRAAIAGVGAGSFGSPPRAVSLS